MTTQYRAAIVGCGRIASTIEDELRDLPGIQPLPYSHAGAYRAAEGVELVAAVDSDRDKAVALAERWGVEDVFDDVGQMLEEVRPDIVSICVPTRWHADVMAAVAESGVPGIVLEKPVSTTLEQADRLLEIAQRRGIVVAINHTRTYDPLHERARELIAEGFIGTPHTVFCSWGEGWSFGGSHLFDLLRRLLDSDAIRVYGEGEGGSAGDPGGNALITYANGATALVAAPREPKAPL